MIQIHINKACAHLCSPPEVLTAGMAKAVGVRFAFSEDWDGLTKTAVFSNGRATVDVLAAKWDGDTVMVAPEVLAVPGRYVRVGVYGTNASGVVLPTVWVTLGKVQPAAEPSGDPSTDPTLPVWAQLREIIGDLNNLTTKAKENLVAAINEAAKTGSGGAGSIDLRTADGYIQYSNDGGETWENLIALADLKGEKGDTGAPGTPGANGTDGKDGTTFTPSVSAAGDLSWTNDGGKANPAPVNIKGPQGETGPQGPTGATGPQGAPGADYTLTDADKTEIAAEVIAGGVEAQLGPVPLPAPASAAVGQIVKIKAVDAAGKITETEAVDMPTGDVTVEEVNLEDDTDAVSFSLDGCEMFALVIDCPVVDVNHTYALPIVNSIVGSFIVLNYADTKSRWISVLQINKVSDGLWFFAFKQGNSATAASANLNSIGSTTVINNMIPMEITHLGLKAYTNQSIPKGTKIYAIRGKTIL